MDKLFRTFLADIFDYAGLFPPASLSLEKALNEYVKYRHSRYDWMLARFVISHDRLEELYDVSARQANLPDPFRLSITSSSTQSFDEFLNTLATAKANIYEIHKSLSVKLKTDVLEIKLPDEVLRTHNQDDILDLLNEAADLLGGNHLLPEMVFFEVPGFEFDAKKTGNILEVLQEHQNYVRNRDYEYYTCSGFKIRCGGVQAFQFPPTAYLSEAINMAASRKIPMKFTAGLHHPVRAYHTSVETKMHGFLNVLGAAIISAVHHPESSVLKTILEDEEAANFKFTSDYFAWGDYKVPQNKVEELRKKEITTIGSCSIEEPVEDLTELKLIST